MPKIDLQSIEQTNRTGYPAPFADQMAKRHYRRIGTAAGLEDFGVSHVVLEPGGISSQRHWHEAEDEFVVILEGEAVLIEDEGETLLKGGDCAAFPKGVPNGHQLVNRSTSACTLLAFGRVAASDCHYSDIDLRLDIASGTFTHRDGMPYEAGSS